MKYLGNIYCGKKGDCGIYEKYKNKKGQEYGAFLCMCGGLEAEDAGEQMAQYTVRRLQERVRGHMQYGGKIDWDRLCSKLHREVETIRQEIGKRISRGGGYLAGGVRLENDCLIFIMGNICIYQINRLFGRGHLRVVCGADGEKEQLAVLEVQPDVGLLFLTEEALGRIGKERLVACLYAEKPEDMQWINKRVRELGQVAQESLAYLIRGE